MKKAVVLTQQERAILAKLPTEHLRLLVGIRDGGFLTSIISIVNLMIDVNKNYFFGENELNISAEKLALKHAELRGEAAGQMRLIYLIQGAASELLRREEQTKKKKGV